MKIIKLVNSNGIYTINLITQEIELKNCKFL